jgi:hypothetical protein
MAVRLQWVLAVLGICAVTASIVVTTFTEELGVLGTRIAAAITAISIGYISFFQIPKKIGDLWTGWRHLNAALVLYEEGKIDIEKLTQEYERAEEMIGVMEANVSLLSKDAKGANKA